MSSDVRRSAFTSCGVALLTLALAFVAGESNAKGLSAADLMGRWCGNTSTYTFTPSQLTVGFKTGQKKVLHIKSIEVQENYINVHWVEASNTVFSNFKNDTMAQDANTYGDMGPKREFHRCR